MQSTEKKSQRFAIRVSVKETMPLYDLVPVVTENKTMTIQTFIVSSDADNSHYHGETTMGENTGGELLNP